MAASDSRTSKSLKNTVFGLIGLLSSQIANFVSRSIFIGLLGAEYNGVNGLFSNILSLLNLAELGFATSIAYALYKPLKTDYGGFDELFCKNIPYNRRGGSGSGMLLYTVFAISYSGRLIRSVFFFERTARIFRHVSGKHRVQLSACL